MLRILLCCLLVSATWAGEAVVNADYRTATEHEWRDLVKTMSPLSIEFAGTQDDRYLSIECRGSGWAVTNMPKLPAGRVHVIEVELRCRDQVEKLSAVVRQPGKGVVASSMWPIEQEWRTHRLQWRSKTPIDRSRFELDLSGSGTVDLRSLRLLQQDAFILEQADAPAPDAGELIYNHDFSLGLVGWRRGWSLSPWHFGIDEKLGTVTDGVLTMPRLDDNKPDVRPLSPDRNISLVVGKTYYVRLRGRITEGSWELKLVVPNTGWDPERLKSWRIDKLDGEWEQQFTFEAPEYGQLRSHNQVYPVLLARGPGAHRIESFAISEGAPPASAPAAVAEFGGKHIDRAYLLGDAVPVTVRRNEQAQALPLQLEVRDLSGAVRLQQVVADDVVVLPPQPVGWYQLTVTGESVRERPVEFVVLPDPKAHSVDNGFLGTHVRDFVWHNTGLIDPMRVEQAERIGYGYYRWFQGWGWHEQDDGTWRENQASARLLDNAGSILLVLSETPKKRRIGDHPGSDQWPGIGPFVAATTRMLTMYPGRIDAVEIYNEPDMHRKLTPEDHAELCKETYAAVKAIDPNITVVAGAITTAAQDWLVRSIDAGMLDGCDVVSVHGYVRDKSAHIGARAMRDLVAPVQAAMARHKKVKPIWDTESGFGVEDGAAGAVNAEVHVKSLVTRQAVGITRHYAYAAMPKRYPDDSGFTYLIGHNGRPSVTQPMVGAFHRLTGDATFDQELGDDAAGVHIYRWHDPDGRAIVAGWTSLPEGIAQWPFDITGLVALDRFGQPVAADKLSSHLVYLLAADDPKTTSCTVE
ncbi:MAG: hypothetical protein PF961_20205 [Planctomycetota bacterium]|jgi:hypothetical protein|nr:hypothetical protein [Planctomycetota bacterium]